MSPIDFEILPEPDDSRVRCALKQLRIWLENHRGVQVIDPRDFAREAEGLRAEDIVALFAFLMREGVVCRVYKVVGPSTGTLLDEEFARLSEVPPKLPDRFDNWFDTAEAEKIVVFREIR